jgi:hypothetical protein
MLDAETQSAPSAQADQACKSKIALNKHRLVQLPHIDANHQAKTLLRENCHYCNSTRASKKDIAIQQQRQRQR